MQSRLELAKYYEKKIEKEKTDLANIQKQDKIEQQRKKQELLDLQSRKEQELLICNQD